MPSSRSSSGRSIRTSSSRSSTASGPTSSTPGCGGSRCARTSTPTWTASTSGSAGRSGSSSTRARSASSRASRRTRSTTPSSRPSPSRAGCSPSRRRRASSSCGRCSRGWPGAFAINPARGVAWRGMNAPGAEAESPLDVERVEGFPATPETVRVRVVGRWRGAPPAVAPVLLVGELALAAGGHGVIDGVWRATFSVAVEMRGRLERRLGLRVGDAELGLPAASAGPADESSAPPPGEVVGRGVLDERRARRFEGVEGSLVRRAEAAEAEASTRRTQLEHLEQRLREAGADSEADRAKIAGLRERVVTAERHAAELSREMDAVRREGEEALEAAVAARREAEAAARTALEREAEAARLVESAGDPAGAPGARGAELEAGLARREDMQERVGAELATLRAELERVREASSGGAAAARVAELEAREREARDELAARDAELGALRGELSVQRDEAAGREAALREALATADGLR